MRYNEIMIRLAILLIILLVMALGLYRITKPVPSGVGVASPVYPVSAGSVLFLSDKTYTKADGTRVREQEIFDTVFKLIREADSYVLVDMFLFNDLRGAATTTYRSLSEELVTTLIEKKKISPDVTILLITDPLNTIYGSYTSPQFAQLGEHGIEVILTDLTKLRDSNPLYSMVWRPILRYMPNIGGAWLPNMLDPQKPKVTLSSYLTLFNFKANHRKLIVADSLHGTDRVWRTLVTSANPHDGSSEHSNIALLVEGTALASSVLTSEQAVAQMAEAAFLRPSIDTDADAESSDISVQLLTERAIKDAVLAGINRLERGDSINLVMFYLSDRDVIKALKRAADRDVMVRIILDPNKDAFGRQKGGIPNRSVAHELIESSSNISIRWCATNGEQCHSKMIIMKKESEADVILGSANFTRRNLNNFNLETNVRLMGPVSTKAVSDAQAFFDTLWENRNGDIYSTPYETYAEDKVLKTLLYRFGEFTGLSTY
jgi:phosphatidylserine/phosphatidylglycerophosphate/cardiolipin synthase-like enzyme